MSPTDTTTAAGEDAASPPAVIDEQRVRYRTAFETRLDLLEATDRVRDQFRAWLQTKEDVDVHRFDARETTVGPGTVVLYAATNTVTGWQLREKRRSGVTWVSTAAVTRADTGRAWVSLNVEAMATEGRPPPAERPRLISLLLDAIDAYDEEAVLRARPELITESRVEYLLEVVCSPARRLPVVVAAPPSDLAFDQWRELVDKLTRNLPGLASMYVLDPVAVDAFNDGIGATHVVGPACVRTYLCDVDPAISEDAVRHRILSRQRIEEDPRRASRLIAVLPRQLAASSAPPAAAASLEFSWRNFTRAQPAATPTPHRELAQLREQNTLLTGLLEVADVNAREDDATITRQRDELLDLAGELETARDEVEKLGNTVRALQRRLVAAGRYGDAYSPADGQFPLPRDFGELLDRLPELAPCVVFTGAREQCLNLDEHAQSSTWSQVAWQALLALRNYAEHKRTVGFEGDFKRWCQSPPDGARVVSPGKVASGESDTVRNNPRMARERTFPVPAQVAPGAAVFMGAHVRLGQVGAVAPRLHFHDATSSDGTVYVGYIGRHLANTRTS